MENSSAPKKLTASDPRDLVICSSKGGQAVGGREKLKEKRLRFNSVLDVDDVLLTSPPSSITGDKELTHQKTEEHNLEKGESTENGESMENLHAAYRGSGLLDLSVPFSDFGERFLDRRLTKAVLTTLNLKYPTLVQSKAIPLILQGKDILARARTGSGKTLAYILPMVQQILTRTTELTEPTLPLQGCVLVPTKELCAQVCYEMEIDVCDSWSKISLTIVFTILGLPMLIHVILFRFQVFNVFLQVCEYCHSWVAVRHTSDSLNHLINEIPPTVIVATPKSLLSYLSTNREVPMESKLAKKNFWRNRAKTKNDLRSIFKKNIRMIVLDEADAMMTLGFRQDLETLFKDILGPRKIENGFQTVLCSATLNSEVRSTEPLPSDVYIEKWHIEWFSCFVHMT